jgi:hypothetical protein
MRFQIPTVFLFISVALVITPVLADLYGVSNSPNTLIQSLPNSAQICEAAGNNCLLDNGDIQHCTVAVSHLEGRLHSKLIEGV